MASLRRSIPMTRRSSTTARRDTRQEAESRVPWPADLLAELRAARASLNRELAALETANGANVEDRE